MVSVPSCCEEASVASAIETWYSNGTRCTTRSCEEASVASAIETGTVGFGGGACPIVARKQASRLRLKQRVEVGDGRTHYCCEEASVASAIETHKVSYFSTYPLFVARKRASRLRLKLGCRWILYLCPFQCCEEASVASAIETSRCQSARPAKCGCEEASVASAIETMTSPSSSRVC